MHTSYGGIVTKSWAPNCDQTICLANQQYLLFRLSGSNFLQAPTIPFEHFTIYASPDKLWTGKGTITQLPLTEGEIWIAGKPSLNSSINSALERKLEPYTVQKPWGAEYWLSGEHPLYCFKKIRLNKGKRTSLQYHREKIETNIIISGRFRLHFQKYGNAKDAIHNADDIDAVELEGPITMDVAPFTVHRLEALTDLEFLEVSTPQVNDVVRISDDSKRANGRIESEHRQ